MTEEEYLLKLKLKSVMFLAKLTADGLVVDLVSTNDSNDNKEIKK